MLQTFIDDSGKAEEPFFVLAGFTSLVERWVEFANAWKLKLQEPPKIRYFKMREAAALRGEFLNFTERQRDRRLEDLIGIINAHASFFVFCEVNRDAWKQAFQKQISKTLDSPYYHAYCSQKHGLTPTPYGVGQRFRYYIDLYIAGQSGGFP